MDDIPPNNASPFPGDGDLEQIDKISQPDNLVPKSFDDMLDKFGDDNDDDDVMVRGSDGDAGFGSITAKQPQSVALSAQDVQDKRQEGGEEATQNKNAQNSNQDGATQGNHENLMADVSGSPGNKSVVQTPTPGPLDDKQNEKETNFVQGLPQEDVLHNYLLEPDENIDLDTDQFALFAKKASQQPPSDSKAGGGKQDPNESIKMICDTHKAPAVFFSNKEDRYVCFKCLVSSEKLLYIDKSYKAEMEYFEQIKNIATQAIKSNQSNLHIMREWKYQIRTCLMKIKERFNNSIDKFIYEFGKVFKNVEQSKDLRDFKGEDNRLLQQVDELEQRYMEIQKIFSNIASSTAQKRIQYIDSIKNYMKGLEKRIKEQDLHVKTQAKKLREATDKTVSLDGIEQKMEVKLIKYMNKEHRKKYTNTNINMGNGLNDTQAIFQDMQFENRDQSRQGTQSNAQRGPNNPQRESVADAQHLLAQMDLSKIEMFHEQDTLFGDHMPSMNIDQSLRLGSRNTLMQGFAAGSNNPGPQYGHSNLQQQPRQAAVAQSAPNPLGKDGQKPLIQKYRHKGLNSLYFLKPKSQSIYLLDFKRQCFIKEKLDAGTLLPTCFTSVQCESGKIFMVGGLVKDLVMKNAFQVDENLVYSELATMKVGRFNAPIALLRDKCVIVAGGQVTNSKNKFTNAVELYDSLTNKWASLDSLQKPRGNTSLTAIANRFVYIYHGLSTSLQTTNTNSIEMIDVGQMDNASLKQARWVAVPVSNNDFIHNRPVGSAQVSHGEVIIFGGQGNYTYSLDVSHHAGGGGEMQTAARLSRMPESNLLSDTRFCQDSDFRVRTFGNYLYAVDGQLGSLHVYSIKDKQWNFSRLDDLGIE